MEIPESQKLQKRDQETRFEVKIENTEKELPLMYDLDLAWAGGFNLIPFNFVLSLGFGFINVSECDSPVW